MKKTSLTDDQLLESFFAEARTPLPDDGFVERVVAALPEHRASFITLRSLSKFINVVGVVAVVIVSAILFSNYITTLHVADFSFNFSSLFVNCVLFLHRLPDYIPRLNFEQIVGIAVATVVLMTLFIQQFATLLHKAAR